ncbi:MAG: manganese efflux pump [Clostridia bacterium]|nr:manganese efflux pump [Clostridia bacterium]
MNLLFVVLGAFLVSIDSFISGFSLSNSCKNKKQLVFGVATVVLALCFLTNYLGVFLQNVLTEKTACLGGIILILIGVFNLLNIKKEINYNKPFLKILLVGFAVGLDGAFFNLSLSIMGFSHFYLPFIIAFVHGFMIYLSTLLYETKIFNFVRKFSFIAPCILIVLGVYKLLLFFL